jgi:hypothetical protein
MSPSINSIHTANPTASIEGLYLSVRTYNRLRKMGISDIGEMARRAPEEFLAVDGFGKKCLYEIAEILEKFYASLDARQLALIANIAELWRPYFPHPERVPSVLFDPNPPAIDPVLYESDQEAIQAFDPTRNSQAQLPVKDLPISVRARNVLKVTRITTLDDLAQISPDFLIKNKNCGRKTIQELATLLKQYFESLPSSAVTFYGARRASWLRHANGVASNDERSAAIFLGPQSLTVTEVIENSLARLRERHSAILAKRMGLSQGQSRKTLEAIGREFHMTRERVRQIVAAGLKLILKSLKTCRPDLYQGIRRFIRAHEVVSLDEIATAIPDLGNSTRVDPRAYVRLLMFANQDEAHPLDFGGNVWASKEITPEFHRKVLRAARNTLNGIPMPCAHVSVEVAKFLREFDDRQIRTIQKILLNSSGKLRIELSPEGELLCPPRQNTSDRRRAFIYGYIKEQGVPVQMQEIFSALQDSEPELIPDSPTRRSAVNAIVSNLNRDDRFAWAGSSTWGLREWGYVSRGSSVGAAALEILRASSVPLSTTQIRTELSHLYRVSSAGVSVALKASEGVTIERDSQGLWKPI